MTNLALFSFDLQEVRTIILDETPWFIAQDVFKVFDIAWKRADSLKNIPKSWKKLKRLDLSIYVSKQGPLAPARTRVVYNDTWLINESAVYKIAFRSDKPNADRFVDWVAGEVLPSIRKTGAYSVADSNSEFADIIKRTLTLSKQQMRQLVAELPINTIEIEKEELMPAIEYVEKFLKLNRHTKVSWQQLREGCDFQYTDEQLTEGIKMLCRTDNLKIYDTDGVKRIQYI